VNPRRASSPRRKSPFVGPIERLALENTDYRHVVYTPTHLQLVLMALRPGEEIGREVHPRTDQFFRIEQGSAVFLFGREGEQRRLVRSGDAVVVPAGVWHNVVNPSRTRPLKLYTIYSPPHHPPGTLQRSKPPARSPR